MFKLIAFFALLAAAFAAPKPDPLTLTYGAGIGLPYDTSIGSHITYSNLGYPYVQYAPGYYNNYYPSLYRYY